MPISIERIQYSDDGAATVFFAIQVSNCARLAHVSVNVAGPEPGRRRDVLERSIQHAQSQLRKCLADSRDHLADADLSVEPLFADQSAVRVAAIERPHFGDQLQVDFAVRGMKGVPEMTLTVLVPDQQHPLRLSRVVRSARETIVQALDDMCVQLEPGYPSMLHDPEIADGLI